MKGNISMFDRNGLELTPVAESLNSYKLTAVNVEANRYSAYAAGTRKHKNEWNMFRIGNYKDPRDAAFVAQEFAKQYDQVKVRQLVTDGLFNEVAREFRENIEIPEWQFPAEGLTIEDITCDYGYKTNRVDCAKEALREAVKVFEVQVPSLKEIPTLVKKVQALYDKGHNYREAAKMALEV